MASPPTSQRNGTGGEENDRALASAVMSGTALGRSLRQALDCLMDEEKQVDYDNAVEDGNTKSLPSASAGSEGDPSAPPNNPNEYVVETERRGTKMVTALDRSATDRIWMSFGDAVAATPKNTAPRALLRGRCGSYNRFGQNWMVSMDQVRLKGRPSKLRKLRHRERTSLWDRDETSQGEVRIGNDGKRTVQLLAYGDTV